METKSALWGWQVAHYSMIKVAPYLLIKHIQIFMSEQAANESNTAHRGESLAGMMALAKRRVKRGCGAGLPDICNRLALQTEQVLA